MSTTRKTSPTHQYVTDFARKAIRRRYETDGPTRLAEELGLTYKQVQYEWQKYTLGTKQARAAVAVTAAQLVFEKEYSYSCRALTFAAIFAGAVTEKQIELSRLYCKVFGVHKDAPCRELILLDEETAREIRVLMLCVFSAVLADGSFTFDDLPDGQ